MPTKTCAVSVKATAADDASLKDGQFMALASVFNNVDAVNDVVMPGAFTDDLKAWSDSGDPIPLLWGHQMADPDMNIGHVLQASETDVGLQIRAELDLDNPKAAQVYRLLKGRRVSKMSFAYDIEDCAPAERGGKSVTELRKLKLHEVSVVQVPANPAATIQAVKAAAERRDEHLKAASTNRELIALMGQVLNLLTPPAAPDGEPAVDSSDSVETPATGETDSNDGKANPAPPVTAENSAGVKTDSPALPGPASFRLHADLAGLSAEVDSLSD